jgi:homoserine acetyltransferase
VQLKEGPNPLVGAGKALDPASYFIVRVGLLGGSDVRAALDCHGRS